MTNHPLTDELLQHFGCANPRARGFDTQAIRNPLTDELLQQIGCANPRARVFDTQAMRTAYDLGRDHQLEQIMEWLDEHLTKYSDDAYRGRCESIYDLEDHLKKAMRPTTQEEKLMNHACKYWDCGWCYAPDNVGTNADAQSACVKPSFCPYLGWTDSGLMLTKNFERLQAEVAAHVAADRVAQGSYKTCFIGCLANGHDDPGFIENEYGIPLTVSRIAESIFEGLRSNEAVDFFAALPEAVGSDGKDLTLVGWKFLAAELRALPPVADDTQAVINSVINGMDLLGEGKEWPTAAAWSAAARSTAATADASRLRQRDTLLRLIKEAPINTQEEN